MSETDKLPPLSFHLMHPGGPSGPGDPNAAFYLDGVCHLHYILRHPWKGGVSFSFVHVSSPDLIHWTWHETRLQPAFTGHGMFSGTGFLTREGRPAVIYHGQGAKRNFITLATDRRLTAWEKPWSVEARTENGDPADIPYWDPDCFLIGDTYYAISGGLDPPLMKSKDLKHWTWVGSFLAHDMPDVALGEDISCPNFFRLGDKWMLLCISHSFGCRYYLGQWDADAEQFVPEAHGRMNWRREGRPVHEATHRDVFAPESVLTPDGRRVMWAWLMAGPEVVEKTVQSLPRELSLGPDGRIRIRPLRELETLRAGHRVLSRVRIPCRDLGSGATPAWGPWAKTTIADLPGDAVEIRIRIARAQAERKRFGFELFAGGDRDGLLILFRPEAGTLRVGATEAPFAVTDLPAGEPVEMRIFFDRYLAEVFVNDRRALVATHVPAPGARALAGYAFGAPVDVERIDIWTMRPANQGYFEARASRVWAPTE